MSRKPIVPYETRFLVSSPPRYELDAASEVWHCLHATGICEDAQVFFVRDRDRHLAGLIAIVFDGDPITAARAIRGYLARKPWIMRYALRIIPTEIVCVELSELENFVRSTYADRIENDDTWMIRVSKHASRMRSSEIIDRLARHVDRGKVSLEHPRWIINVEVIRNTFLAAIIRPDDIIRKKEVWSKLRHAKLLEYVDPIALRNLSKNYC